MMENSSESFQPAQLKQELTNLNPKLPLLPVLPWGWHDCEGIDEAAENLLRELQHKLFAAFPYDTQWQGHLLDANSMGACHALQRRSFCSSQIREP